MQAQRKEQTGNLQTANAYAAPAGAIGVSGTPEAGLEHLASSAIHAGFRNFDDAVASYYAAQINTATPLAIEQRYSRNGRLPSILAAVYRNSQGWSEWERRAYNDEVMVSAERILERELQAFIGGHMFQELGRSIDRCHASRAAGDLEFGDQLMLVKKAVTIGVSIARWRP